MSRSGGRVLAVVTLVVLAGCASTPPAPPSAPDARPEPAPLRASDRIARAALAQVGRPYRAGGTGAEGFDCSGLVLHSHLAVGLLVPRTAAEQQRAAIPIPRSALVPGDLIFFRANGGAVDHVGVYAGGGRFVHAPGAGRVVELAELAGSWFTERYAGAGRFWTRIREVSAVASAP
jgi:cell wall-associated NlpC family hydrolase